MVSSDLIGGLGNKMFQISAAYSLSIDNNDECLFEIKNFSNAHQTVPTYFENIFRKINFGIFNPKNHYQEPFFHYKSIDYSYDLLISGYFQSEKYFKHNRKKILDLFSIDDHSLNYINKKYGKLLENKTCSIHIRRGDYLSLPNHHPICDISYYLESIENFDKDTLFLIFSNDIEWCKQNLSLDNKIFVENEKDYIDIWLMSLCDHNIIANSSFSWWGAWLNENQNKKVIAPKNWFGSAINHNTKDLYCDGWVLI
jgi:hypothetical protein